MTITASPRRMRNISQRKSSMISSKAVRMALLVTTIAVSLTLRVIFQDKTARRECPDVSAREGASSSLRTVVVGSDGKIDDADEHLEGLSGRLFKGEVVRDYDGDLVYGLGSEKRRAELLGQEKRSGIKDVLSAKAPHCKKWSVVTTIFEPSDSMLKQTELGKDWCMVIVGDKKGPSDYPLGVSGDKADRIVYLNAAAQASMVEKGSPFLSSLPWNHFGRKNLGFLYAIANGAEVIWDFDDDNKLLDTSKGDIVTPCSDHTRTEVEVVTVPSSNQDCTSFNPYISMGAKSLIWTRGIPMSHIKNQTCSDFSRKKTLFRTKIPTSSIGVCQSLAQHDPDVDAIYRLTRDLPFYFSNNGVKHPVLLARHALTPFNAQATMFAQNAFWMLLLPITVHGRVSDIWRSYLGQRLLHDIGLDVLFVDSLVIQHRNVHNYLADLESEQPLFLQSEALVEFLLSWEASADLQNIEGRVEALYIALYERGYLELKDVRLVQEWLLALASINYEFPKLKQPVDLVVEGPASSDTKSYEFPELNPSRSTKGTESKE